jgi:hypothetical protein
MDYMSFIVVVIDRVNVYLLSTFWTLHIPLSVELSSTFFAFESHFLLYASNQCFFKKRGDVLLPHHYRNFYRSFRV